MLWIKLWMYPSHRDALIRLGGLPAGSRRFSVAHPGISSRETVKIHRCALQQKAFAVGRGTNCKVEFKKSPRPNAKALSLQIPMRPRIVNTKIMAAYRRVFRNISSQQYGPIWKTLKAKGHGEIMYSVLVIEDDKTICDLLCSIITKSGYSVDRAENGLDGLDKALSGNYNIILMDLMLPMKTGEEVLRELRAVKNTPVIIISAKLEVYNRIELFRLGADDYITKPFDIDEVMLRIQAVLRRTEAQPPALLTCRDIRLDTGAKRVYVGENEIACTATEYAILELLLKNPKTIFSKRRLYEGVSGNAYLSDDNTMNVHISNLRRKIARFTPEEYIETVYGMGYRLIH